MGGGGDITYRTLKDRLAELYIFKLDHKENTCYSLFIANSLSKKVISLGALIATNGKILSGSDLSQLGGGGDVTEHNRLKLGNTEIS